MAKPLTDDHYFVAVGRAIHLYTLTENCMFCTFSALSSCSDSDLCRAIFYSHDSFAGRRTLLQRVITGGRWQKPERDIADRIIRACETSNRQRRQLAHVHILTSPDGTINQVFFKDLSRARVEQGAVFRKVTRRQLESMLKIMVDCHAEASAAYADLGRLIYSARQKARAKRARGSSHRRKTPEPQPEVSDPALEVPSESGAP
jgi:hypothetical protein